MMTWMEMVGLSRFALYLSSCPCSLLGSGTELPSPTGCFYAAYLWGTQGPLVSVEGDPTAHSPFEQPWVFLELYISAGNYGGITSSSGLSGLCLCKAAVFQIISLCIPGILLLHEGTGSEEWNERASSRATGYSPWVRFLLQESFPKKCGHPPPVLGLLWRQGGCFAKPLSPPKGPHIVVCVTGTSGAILRSGASQDLRIENCS